MAETKLFEVVLHHPGTGNLMYREIWAHHPYDTSDGGWLRFWRHGELVQSFNKDFVLFVRIMQTEEE